MAQAAVASSVAGAGVGGRRATRRRPQRLGRGPDGERDYADAEGEEEEGATLDVLSMVDIRARVLRAGYTETQLMTTIQEVSKRFLPFLVMAMLNSLFCSTKISISGRAWLTAQN